MAKTNYSFEKRQKELAKKKKKEEKRLKKLEKGGAELHPDSNPVAEEQQAPTNNGG